MKPKTTNPRSSEPNNSAQSTPKTLLSSKKASKPAKPSSSSCLDKIYRLPSSLKRTEEFIKNSIQQQRLSSEILSLVGSTFRIKNVSSDHNPSSSASFCFASISKRSNLSETLETLYEEDGEYSQDSIELASTYNSVVDNYTLKSTYKESEPLLHSSHSGSHTCSTNDIYSIFNEKTPSTNEEKKNSLIDYSQTAPKSERLSYSPAREKYSASITCKISLPKPSPKEEKVLNLNKTIHNKAEKIIVSATDIKRKGHQQYQKAILKETQKNIRTLEDRIEKLKESCSFNKDSRKEEHSNHQNIPPKRPLGRENKNIQITPKTGQSLGMNRLPIENRKRHNNALETDTSIAKTRRAEANNKERLNLKKSVERKSRESVIGTIKKKTDILTSIQNFDRKVRAKDIIRYDELSGDNIVTDRCKTEN